MIQSLQLDDNLSANERALLAALAWFCRGEQRFCNPGLDKLMNKSGLSLHYLKQTILMLEQQGLISVERRKDPNAKWKNTSNVYQLKFLKVPEPKRAEDHGVDIWRQG